jgi:hypothetical protein
MFHDNYDNYYQPEKFILKITPYWFSFIEWITILGFLMYISKEVENLFLVVAIWLSRILLTSYISSVIIYKIMHKRVWPKLSKKEQFIWYILIFTFSLLLIVTIDFFLLKLINSLAEIKKY